MPNRPENTHALPSQPGANIDVPVHESMAIRTLVDIARRRDGLDADRCSLVFTHLDTAALLQSNLHQVLVRHHLSDGQFAALVVLFALEPEPISAAVLAEHTAVSRASISETLEKLEALGFATRARDDHDRRVVYVRITSPGRETVDAAINDYLRAATHAARYVQRPDRRKLLAAYLQLLRGIARPGEPRLPRNANAS